MGVVSSSFWRQTLYYFYFSVDPGEHHLCASWQTAVMEGQGHKAAAAHCTAKAEDVYYFSARNTWWHDNGAAAAKLLPSDSDEAQLPMK
jgi:hypothetical protein